MPKIQYNPQKHAKAIKYQQKPLSFWHGSILDGSLKLCLGMVSFDVIARSEALKVRPLDGTWQSQKLINNHSSLIIYMACPTIIRNSSIVIYN